MDSLTMIPQQLFERTPMITPLIGFGIFLALSVLSIAKLLQPGVFKTLAIANTKFNGIHGYLTESFPQNKGGALFLLFNYLLSFGLVLYMSTDSTSILIIDNWIVALIVPFILLVWPLACMYSIGFISGEQHMFTEVVELKLLGAELLGIFYFILAVVVALHPVEQTIFYSFLVWGWIIESCLRLIKSLAVIFQQRVHWYYIILYFCTLEILPLFVAYYVLMQNFSDKGV